MISTSQTNINPFTGQVLSDKYFGILEKRKTLPIWEQREEIIECVQKHQVVLLAGETGSGKTTQVHFSYINHQPTKSFICSSNFLQSF